MARLMEVYHSSVVFISGDFREKKKLMGGKSDVMFQDSMSHFGQPNYWYGNCNVYYQILQLYLLFYFKG